MTIKEVSEKFNISADTLRYYEKVGLIGPIKRKSNIRNYEEEDLKRIEFVKCMRSADFQIEALVKYMKLFDEGNDTVSLRRELLIEQRDILKNKLDKMNKAYERLNYKIDLYDKNLLERM